MSEPRRRRPRVALCAAITADGRLDTKTPLPPALLDFLAPADGDARLIDETLMRKPPPGWEQPVRIVAAGFHESASLSHALDPRFDALTIRRWLCLGPPDLFRALLDAGRVDDLYLLVRPHVDGRRASPTLSGAPTPEFFPHSIACRLRRMEIRGGECLLHYTVTRPRTR